MLQKPTGSIEIYKLDFTVRTLKINLKKKVNEKMMRRPKKIPQKKNVLNV